MIFSSILMIRWSEIFVKESLESYVADAKEKGMKWAKQ